MADTSTKNQLPKDLSEAIDKAAAARTPLDTFRALKEAHRIGVLAHRKLAKSATQKEKALRAVETDMAFLNRHKAKEDVALRAMRSTYSQPMKALAQFNELCRNFAPTYIVEVLQLGAWRLGTPMGMAMFNYRSKSRMAADDNYAMAVLPSLIPLIQDQPDYLRLRDTGIEDLHDQALRSFTQVNEQKLAIESSLRQQERDMVTAAVSMSQAEVAKLDYEEAGFREMVLPERLKKAEAQQAS
jgi:hypothetical protein